MGISFALCNHSTTPNQHVKPATTQPKIIHYSKTSVVALRHPDVVQMHLNVLKPLPDEVF